MKMVNRATLVATGSVIALSAMALFATPTVAQDANAGAGAISGSSSGSTSGAVGVGIGTGTANSSSNSAAGAASESNSVAASLSGTSNSGNSSQGQSITLNSTVPRNTISTINSTIKNVPNVYAPGLAAAGSEVCLGSLSVGGSGAGFGLTFGTTLKDKECTLRLNAKTLAILGYREAARETMCLDPDVRTAMAAAGTPCNSDRAAVVNARAQAAYSQNVAPAAVPATAAYAAAPTAGTQVAGRNCRREYQLVGGWYDVCE